MLVDPLALEVAGQKHRKPFATDTDVSGLRGGANSVSPYDHLFCVLGGVVAACEFEEHPPACFGIIARPVSVIQWHAKEVADVAEVVFSLLGQLGTRDV